jgi:trimethylamine:corrinoid methyltransferase-like protein
MKIDAHMHVGGRHFRPAFDNRAIIEAADALGIESRAHPTFIPADAPVASADFHAFATIILNSRRPWRVSVYGAKMLPFFIEACRIAKGSLDAVKQDPVFAAKAWVTSPFMLDRENIEVAMDAYTMTITQLELR